MSKSSFQGSRRARFILVLAFGSLAAAVGGLASSAQDKYTVQVPNGLPLSDFRGYEDWQVVAVSQTENLLKVMVANPIMMKGISRGNSRQRQALSRRFENRQDRVENPRSTVSRRSG